MQRNVIPFPGHRARAPEALPDGWVIARTISTEGGHAVQLRRSRDGAKVAGQSSINRENALKVAMLRARDRDEADLRAWEQQMRGDFARGGISPEEREALDDHKQHNGG